MHQRICLPQICLTRRVRRWQDRLLRSSCCRQVGRACIILQVYSVKTLEMSILLCDLRYRSRLVETCQNCQAALSSSSVNIDGRKSCNPCEQRWRHVNCLWMDPVAYPEMSMVWDVLTVLWSTRFKGTSKTISWWAYYKYLRRTHNR